MNPNNIELIVNELIDFLNNNILLTSLNDKFPECNISFDCKLWNEGYLLNVKCNTNENFFIPPIKPTFIDFLCRIEVLLRDELSNPNNLNYAFKSQIDRLLFIIIDLRNKVHSIQCIDNCSDILIDGHLLFLLIDSILNLVTLLEVFNSLLTYINNNNCKISKVFELLMGKFVNYISIMQDLLKDWYNVVLNYLHSSSMNQKNYVASYIPRQNIPIPQPNHNSNYCHTKTFNHPNPHNHNNNIYTY